MKTEPTEALKEIKRCTWTAEDFNISDGFESHEVVDKNDAINIANIAFNEAIRWRDPKEELPELLPNRDYSNNVLAQVEGFTETQVMCLLFVPDDEGGWGYVWGNCYGDINGEAEWDDDYDVVGWKPIE